MNSENETERIINKDAQREAETLKRKLQETIETNKKLYDVIAWTINECEQYPAQLNRLQQELLNKIQQTGERYNNANTDKYFPF